MLERGLDEVAVPPAVAPRAEQVVQRQGRRRRTGGPDRVAVEREQERLQAHEVRRDAQEAAALGERLADEPEAQLLEIAETAMDEPARSARRACRDVVALDEATRRSRLTPSSGAPAPVTPPPTISRSQRSFARRARSARRRSSGPPGSPAVPCAAPVTRGRGRRRASRTMSPVPTRSTTITSGVRNTRSWPAAAGGRSTAPRPRASATTATATSSDLAAPDLARDRQPRSASAGMPIGATSTLPARAAPRRVRRPVLGGGR